MKATPQKTTNLLHGNPKKKPRYSLPLKTDFANYEVSDPRALRSWISLMDMYAVLGGAASHFGGPSALAEIVSCLYAHVFQVAETKSQDWRNLFHIVNDAGHCENVFYALKANYEVAGLEFSDLKKFRSMESPLTGHGEVHCFPEGVFLSNGPLGSSLPQAQGLAMADRHAGSPRVTVTIVSDGASMEGEAREAFAAIPGLSHKGLLNPFLLILSDNNTKLSGRIDTESFAMAPTFESLSALGWKVIPLENPHDLSSTMKALEKCLEILKANPQQPVALHAKTIKGYGTKKTAESASGAHGFPLKKAGELTDFLAEIYQGAPVPSEFSEVISELKDIEARLKSSDSGEKIQVGISKAMIAARQKGLPVISITSDLPGSTGVAGFRKEFPQDSFDVGVAEANMISTAAGFSKMGYIPVVDTFAQFGVTKGSLPLIMASLSQAPVIAVFSHTGFQDAADGASHQALSYLAMTCSLPHTRVITLSCRDEAETLMTAALEDFAKTREKGEIPLSTIFFLGRENFPKTFKPDAQYALGKSQILLDTSSEFKNSIAIYASGSLVGEALKATEDLKKEQVGAVVLHASSMNPFDQETLKLVAQKTQRRCVTLDDHQVVGGLASLVLTAAAQSGLSLHLEALGVHQEFGRSAYVAQDLYKAHGMTAEDVVRAAKKVLTRV